MFQSYYHSIDHGSNVLFLNEIVPDQIEKIKDNIRIIDLALTTSDYFIMVIDNIRDFVAACKQYDSSDPQRFITIERLLLNTLNSFYVWKEYSANNSFNSMYKNTVRNINNNHTLELVERLRHKGVHTSPIIDKYIYDVINEKQKFVLDLDKLFNEEERTKFKKKNREVFENPELDIIELMYQFQKEFISFNDTLFKTVENVIRTAVDNLLKYVPKTPPDCYNSFLVDKTTGAYIHVGRKLELLSEKAELIKHTILQ